MSNLSKCLLAGLVILYILSPVDLCPGPIDDVIVALIGLASMKKQIE